MKPPKQPLKTFIILLLLAISYNAAGQNKCIILIDVSGSLVWH